MPTPAAHRRLPAVLAAGLVAAFLVVVAGSVPAGASAPRSSASSAGAPSSVPQAQAPSPTPGEDHVVGLDLGVAGPRAGVGGTDVTALVEPTAPTRPQETAPLTTDGRGPPAS